MDSRHLRKFLSKFKKINNILDIGCGNGSNFVAIKKIHPSANLYGVDMFEFDLTPDINFSKIDIQSQPLPNNDSFFDVIIITHVIEHLNSTQLLTKEISRTLRNGGEVYVEAPNWTSMFVPSIGISREKHGPFNFFDDPSHIRPFSKQSIFEFCFQCNLKNIKVGTLHGWHRLFFDPFLLPIFLATGNRSQAIASIWNLFGWVVYGIGKKI